jgi:hypothetical protein
MDSKPDVAPDNGKVRELPCKVCGTFYPADTKHMCAVDPRILEALMANAAASVVVVQQFNARMERARQAIVIPGEKPAPLDMTPMLEAVAQLLRLGFAVQTTGPRRTSLALVTT